MSLQGIDMRKIPYTFRYGELNLLRLSDTLPVMTCPPIALIRIPFERKPCHVAIGIVLELSADETGIEVCSQQIDLISGHVWRNPVTHGSLIFRVVCENRDRASYRCLQGSPGA